MYFMDGHDSANLLNGNVKSRKHVMTFRNYSLIYIYNSAYIKLQMIINNITFFVEFVSKLVILKFFFYKCTY